LCRLLVGQGQFGGGQLVTLQAGATELARGDLGQQGAGAGDVAGFVPGECGISQGGAAGTAAQGVGQRFQLDRRIARLALLEQRQGLALGR